MLLDTAFGTDQIENERYPDAGSSDARAPLADSRIYGYSLLLVYFAHAGLPLRVLRRNGEIVASSTPRCYLE